MNTNASHDLAIAQMQQGQFDEAERSLQAILSENSNDSRALRLLGTLYHLSARPDAAQDYLERALALEPDSASTLLNLGSVHLGAGRLADASECYERVVAISPDSPDGHFNLGLVAQAEGRADDAERYYRAALDRDENALDARINLAALLLAQARFEPSLTESERALEGDPAHPVAHRLRSEALLRLGRPVDAAHALDAARSRGVVHPELDALEGELQARSGLLDEASAAYRAAIDAGDTRTQTALALARCQLESGRNEESAQTLRAAIAAHADIAACHAMLALALDNAGDHEGALSAIEQALTIEPNDVDYITMSARVLYRLGQDDSAERRVESAIAAAPNAAAPHLLRVEQCIARGDLAAASSACDHYLAPGRSECTLLATKGFLSFALGDVEGGERLLDYDRLIKTWNLSPPPGYGSLSEFNAGLIERVLAHPSLSQGNASAKATQHGRQSGNLLFGGQKGPFADLENMLWQAARLYVESVGQDATHPFLANPPELGAVYGWGVVLERSGYQTPHIHPSAWLSGVYYPKVPAAVASGDSQQGWIEFGAPPPELTFEPAAPTRTIQPKEGLIVLFPSYFYHRTVPYDSDEQRISFAFDFVPRH